MKRLITLISLVVSFSYSNAQVIGTATFVPTGAATHTVCNGSNITMVATGFTAPTITRWEFSPDGNSPWTIIGASASPTITVAGVTVTRYYRAIATTGLTPTNPAFLTVDQPSAGTVTSNATVCSGLNGATLTVAGTFTSVNYWEFSTAGAGGPWTNIANTTTTQAYSNLTTTTMYRANVSNGTCPTANATAATITVNPITVAGTVTGAAIECAGSNSGTLTLSGHTGTVVRWESSTNGGFSWATIANTTTFNNYLNITLSTEYRAVVQSGVCAAENSTSAMITVDPATVGGTTAGAASVCSGSNGGSVTLSGHTGGVTGWESSTDGGFVWNPIVNTTTSQVYSNLTTTTMYRAVVKSGSCNSLNSTATTITVAPPTVAGTTSGAVTVCAGSNSGTLNLSGHTGSVVRWESSTNGGFSWATIANTNAFYNFLNITQSTEYRAVVQSGVCAADNSTSVMVTVDPATVGGTTAGATSVCSGSNGGSVTLSGNTGGVTGWESSTDGGFVWNPIVNTTSSQVYSNLTTTTMYRAVVKSGSCNSLSSSASTITVAPSTVAGSVSGNASVCAGSNSGTLTLSGHTGTIIRWEFSTNGGVTWNNIANTSTIYNYSNIIQTTDYRAVVQSGVCVADNSSFATITVNPVSVAGTVASAATVCTGFNNGTLMLTGYTGTIIRWEYSTTGTGGPWITIVNTTDNHSYNNLATNTHFRAVVQSGGCTAANSNAVLITVSPASAGGTVTGTDTSCAGSNSGMLTLSGYTGSILRWQSSTDGGVTWANIANTSAFYNYSNLTVTTDFRAVIQSGTCPTANSSIVTITIFPISVGGTVNSNATVCSGANNGTLLLINYTGNVMYWEYSIDNGLTYIPVVNTTDTISYSNLTIKTLYRAAVQSGNCTLKKSTVATISVNIPSAGGSITGSDTVCSGSNSGTLQLSGYVGSIVRWQSSTDGGVTWANINNTTAILNYTNLTLTTNYRAVIQSGLCPAANSSEAVVTVFPISVGGTVNSNATVCSGANNGTLLLINYTGNVVQWEYSTDNGFSWTTITNTTDTVSYTNLTVKTLYRALVQSGACLAKYSTIATITVNAATVGGIVSGTDTVCAGSNSGNLILSGYVGSIVRWQSSTDGGVTWANINNTTALYNYVNITTTTNYRSVVQNGGCASVNSTDAMITVFPVSVGGTVTPTAYAACSGLNSGTIVLSGESGTIQNWESSIDGGVTWIPIVNATNSQNFLNLTQTTKYRAITQNGQCAAAYSTISTISVFPATVGGTVAGSDTVCTGTNNGSVVLSGFTGSILNWEFSIDGGVTWTAIANTTAIQNYTNLSITTLYRAVLQSGSCATANSTSATILVNPATVGGSVLTSTFVCDSMTSGVLTLSGYTGSILNWEQSTDGGVTWTNIVNTASTYTYTGITTATMFRADVQSVACPVATAAPATISLAVPAAASFSVVINGATVTFTNTSSSNNGTSFWNFGDGTNSAITSPAHTYTANGSYIVTLIVTDSCGTDTVATTVIINGVGINELAYNNPDVSIYPNPFSVNAIISIADGKNREYAFSLVDIYGKEVMKRIIPAGTDKITIERDDLSGGLYFFKLVTNEGIFATGKVIVE